MKVLIVEDDLDLSRFLTKGLRSEGFLVEHAYDGKIGLSMVQQNTMDCLVVDVNILGINGFELCKLVKKDHPMIPVLMLTALNSLEDKSEGFGAGADDYVVKPVEIKELVWRIRALLHRYSLVGSSKHVSEYKGVVMDTFAKTLQSEGKLIELTAKEFSLL